MTSAFRDDDDFGVGHPTLSLAYHAWIGGVADIEQIEALLLASAMADGDDTTTASSRAAIATAVDQARKLGGTNEGLYRQLRDCADDADDERNRLAGDIANNADQIRRAAEVARKAAEIAFMPVAEPDPIVEGPLPTTKDWASVVQQVRADTLAWVAAHPDPERAMLILRPSPSAGKTESMIQTAVDTITVRKRVTFAARTKEVLEGELKDRITRKRPMLRLHVVTGRDKGNCPNITNVETVQAHGYSPGRTVCLTCDWHPRNAFPVGMQPCEYFGVRIRAQNDTKMARRGIHEYPLILTTHAALATAADSSGGMYGNFWAADLVIIDEDPTEAFETEVYLQSQHIEFDASRNPQHMPIANLAELLRHAVALAKDDRKDATRRGYFVDVKARVKETDPVHSRQGSLYAGRDLHRLLNRALALHPQKHSDGRIKTLQNVLRDAADLMTPPGVGELLGITTTEDMNKILPHHGLAQLSDTVLTEMRYAHYRGLHLVKTVTGKEPATLVDEHAQRGERLDIDDVIDRYTSFDIPFQARLTCSGDVWTFAIHQFSDLNAFDSNVIIGDAYAQEDHYRSLFDKPKPMGGVDPVTIIDHVAHFPPGSIVWRFRTQANIGHLEDGFWSQHAEDIAEILRHLAGKKVLVYGHLSLRERFEDLMQANANFGLDQWAYEHWWGGRGKDHYRHFDAVVTISEPIMNLDGMICAVNGRAMRDVVRAGGTANVHHLLEGIRFVKVNNGIAAAWRDPRLHPRLRHEHERQNTNEQAQALHRVRGLISPKIMVQMGSGLEMTRDTIAASSTVDRPLNDRGDLVDGHPHAFLTADELLEAMLAIDEHYGVFSPLFAHAMATTVYAQFFSNISQPSIQNDGSDDARAVTGWPADGHGFSTSLSFKPWPSAGLNGAATTLIERVWTPVSGWETVTKRVRETRAFKDALNDFRSKAKTESRMTPTWKLAGQRIAQPYLLYSTRLDLLAASQAFRTMLTDRYGPTVNGTVQAPRRLPLVPF